LARTKGVRNADYEAKRRELLARMLPRFVDRAQGRPSFRQFAAAAGVTMPTLRHYFGGRADVVGAILEAYREAGSKRLERASRPAGPFAVSVRDFVDNFILGMRSESDMFASTLAEGLVDAEIGPRVLQYLLDPALEALQSRLSAHVASGEMRDGDLRAASMMLFSSLLVAVMHQDQMGGAASSPVDLETTAHDIADAFVRAWAA
jgi:AcrR family transcriptional regulator